MTSESARDPVTDHLLTPHNAALVVIDYQPSQVQTVTSMDRELLVDNIISVARLARTFDLPVVLSTSNVTNGQHLRENLATATVHLDAEAIRQLAPMRWQTDPTIRQTTRA
jgi:nicotinamidase-related amidase